MRTSPGLMLILSAPSGAGKTTLAHKLIGWLGERGLFSVSYTTRAPRGAEREGVDYCFVDEPTFLAMAERGELLESAKVHGNWYGSHQRFAEEAQRGRVVLFDIDVQGGEQIQAKHPEAVSVFILPPSVQELERRLRDRKTDSEAVIQKRMAAARAEVARGTERYDYLVVNDDLERAFEELKSVVRAESCRRVRWDRRALPDLGGPN